MSLYNSVHYIDSTYKVAVSLAIPHGEKITFHKNCQIIKAGFAQNNCLIRKITFPKNLKAYGAYIKTLENLEVLIDNNYNLKKINKLFKKP